MKKLTSLVILAAFGATAFTSCKKDYTCDCKINGETAISYEMKNVKKKDAKTACEGYNASVPGLTYSCDLK